MAREFHDEIGQILTTAIFSVDSCFTELPAENAIVADRLRRVRETLVVAIHDVRRLVYDLAPPMLLDLGLVPTLRWLIERFQEQHEIVATVAAPDRRSV